MGRPQGSPVDRSANACPGDGPQAFRRRTGEGLDNRQNGAHPGPRCVEPGFDRALASKLGGSFPKGGQAQPRPGAVDSPAVVGDLQLGAEPIDPQPHPTVLGLA
jgi:hypothetical protein